MNTWYILKVVYKDNILTVIILQGITVINTVTLTLYTATDIVSFRVYCDKAMIALKI